MKKRTLTFLLRQLAQGLIDEKQHESSVEFLRLFWDSMNHERHENERPKETILEK